jgi:hypothetical protein
MSLQFKYSSKTALAIVVFTSLAILYYKVYRTFEKFVAMQEFIYIPPQRNASNMNDRGSKCKGNRRDNCDNMYDLTSLGSLPPTVLQGGITVQTMGPLGPMHIGGDPNPYANQYYSAMNALGR